MRVSALIARKANRHSGGSSRAPRLALRSTSQPLRRPSVGAILGRPLWACCGRRARLGGARPIVRRLNEPGGLIERPRTYFIGFVGRPIGAAIFGHYGDRIGRKATLIATLMCMGLATFAVASVPTYASIGIWGAILLVLQMIQGIGIGGKSPFWLRLPTDGRATHLRPIPRRGLSHDEAAMYVGVSAGKFDDMINDGRMPAPRRIDGRKVWDVRELDLAFDALPRDDIVTARNSWEDR